MAQYGQWDGYPAGAGIDVLEFMRDKVRIDEFKEALRNSRYISKSDLTALWTKYGASSDGFISIDKAVALDRDYPQFSRDTGAEILELVQKHPEGIVLQNSIEFAANSLFCEWAWVIDLDAGTLECYEGFNTRPLNESDRFYFLHEYEKGKYHGVNLTTQWNLNNLPVNEDFLAELEDNDDHEDDYELDDREL